MRGWPDDGTGAAAPEADVEALVAWGRFTDAAEALAQLEQALPALEQGADAPALLLALYGRALLSRVAGHPVPDVVQACDLLERAALERRAPLWAATAAALRARARLDDGDVGGAMTDLTRVDLERLGAALTGRGALLLLDTLAGAYARLRLDERVDDVRDRIERGLDGALPLDRAVHWGGWATQLAARALDDVAAGRGEPDHDLLERALAVSARLDELPRSLVPDQLRRGVQGVRALAAAYRGRPSEALRLLGQDAFAEPRDLPPLERQVVTLAAIHAHALVGSIATARSLDDAAGAAPAGLPHLVLEACRTRERLWLETHAGGSVVPVLTRLDGVLVRIGWLGMDLMAQTARQVLEHQALRAESRTDPLTGVGNRRALDEELRHMLRFTPMPLALVLVDIDDFKQVNDAFTHVVGDEVLRRVAECLGRELRAGDHLARYGGDEFIALLPRTGDQEARQVAQRMSDAIVALPWGELTPGLAVRVSTGSAALWSLTGRRPDRDAENLFRRADEALLDAKRERARSASQPSWPVGGRRRRVGPVDVPPGAPASGSVPVSGPASGAMPVAAPASGSVPVAPPVAAGPGAARPLARRPGPVVGPPAGPAAGPATAPVTIPLPARPGPAGADRAGADRAGADRAGADRSGAPVNGATPPRARDADTNGSRPSAWEPPPWGHAPATSAERAPLGRPPVEPTPLDRPSLEPTPLEPPWPGPPSPEPTPLEPPPGWRPPAPAATAPASMEPPPSEPPVPDAGDQPASPLVLPDDETLPPQGTPAPGPRRRRATVIDLGGASPSRTPFG